MTGGAGFIGSHLCEELAVANQIVCLDDFSTGVKANKILSVEYVEGSTCHTSSLIKFSPDIVFHLGEYSRVEQSFEDIESVWKSNVLGAFEVIKFCLANNRKLIYTGSNTKYGDGGLGRDQTPCAWTKASNTELIANFGRWYGLKYAVCYFYNAYGPREIRRGKYATLSGIFSEKYLSGESLPVVDPGTQRRNFTHVKEIVAGVILGGEKGGGDGYGIGNQASYTVLEVARMFNAEIKMLPARAGNRLDAYLNNKKLLDLG